ncbi:sensor domain-containing diguanylate cyclase [Vulgatibacter sp.]|uniref:GGDEF domain-containing protein n=1 Tax=Vulgatibacter sp. TaxID=1971226 RepID=UPI00356514EB
MSPSFHHTAAGRFLLLAALPCVAAGIGGAVAAGAGWRLGLAVGLASLAGVAAVAWLVLLAPLRRLAQSMARVRDSRGIARLPVLPPAEVGQVAETVNELLAELVDHQAAAIERSREVSRMQEELSLQPELQRETRLVEEANRRLAERLRELSLLFDITRSLNSTLELGELLGRLSELVATTLGFDGFAVLLVDETQGDLLVRTVYGVLPERFASGDRQPIGAGPAGDAVATGELVLQRSVEVGGEDGSLLAVPMQHKDQVVGALLFARRRIDGFAPEDLKLLGSIAGQAALAIANARLYEQMVALSITDALTGAYNRRHLFAHLEMELRRAERYGDAVTVAMIDIDHFKQLNDTYGHATGDRVLQEVAAALRRKVRRVDTVARFGGEEFAVILPRLPASEAVEVAEKIRLAIHEVAVPGGGSVAASVGVATFPADGGDAIAILDAADSALYASKRGGRNRSTAYRPGMELHPERRRQITAAEAEVPLGPAQQRAG